MRVLSLISFAAAIGQAALLPAEQFTAPDTVQALQPRNGFCNPGPWTRACWYNGYSIFDDYDKRAPHTGVTVSYHFTVTNGTCNPDGHGPRVCMFINGQTPGPTIEANWGDTIQVTLTNELQNNGTTFHFHGVRQLNSCGSDGVAGVTQCPVPPGGSYTYTFQASQHGTSWYHSHYTVQYGDGVLGPLVIYGPATANYDVDLGPMMVTDWYYQTAFAINEIASYHLQDHLNTPPPGGDNMLINGMNKDASGAGAYPIYHLQPWKKYRLRLINSGVDNYIRVSLDHHQFQVIAADFVPIQPFTAQWLLLAMGQRYDVIITANQWADNYWFRAIVAKDCGSLNDGVGLSIFRYNGAANPTGDPVSTAWPTPPQDCLEPQPKSFWYEPVPSGDFNSVANTLNLTFTSEVVCPNTSALVVWALNDTGMIVYWDSPVLSGVRDHNLSFPQVSNVLNAAPEGHWNYWIMQQNDQMPPIPHPIHLHGHDFYVIGQGNGTFNQATAKLNWFNPTRRDTASLPSAGWLALAWESDNPGAWLMHCHIAWHASEGLGVQFLESSSTIVMPDANSYNSNCAAWTDYYNTAIYTQTDSGF